MLRSYCSCLILAWLGVASGALTACAPVATPPKTTGSILASTRAQAATDAAQAADWLLLELLHPGGTPQQAVSARALLDKSERRGAFEDLARGLDDELHGKLEGASAHYLASAAAARLSSHPSSELIAWFAIQRAIGSSSNTQSLWKRSKAWVEESLRDPKHLGWRARDLLVDWWSRESWADAASDVTVRAAAKLGCLPGLRLAGPFGTGSGASALADYPAATSAPWPVVWPHDEHSDRLPRILESEQEGCFVTVDEATQSGVYFVEALFESDHEQRLILSVENALSVWVDGNLVQDRDFRRFGSWTKAGVGLTIPKGPHRVVAKVVQPRTAVRVLLADGRPASLTLPKSQNLAAKLGAPELSRVSFEANPSFKPDQYHGGKGAVMRYIAAALAHADGEDGAASLLVEPLVKDTKTATGPALSLAAEFVAGDPIYNSSQTEDLIRELNQLALARDPNLWSADLERVKKLAKSKGLVDAVLELRKLTQRYPEVPALSGALANAYGELGWTPEYREAVMQSAERFPESIDGLYSAAQLFEAEGQQQKAGELFDRVRQLDPNTEVFVGRALERKDYALALTELERLHKRRPKNKELLDQIATVKRLAGGPYDVWRLLEDAVARDPKNGAARLSLADAKYASGERGALHAALVESIVKGANAGPLRRALDLVEGLTKLEPYRLDGKEVIREYEAAGKHMPGTAARVLDYMAVWVSADGSSRSLEHQVIRLQSEEAIRRFAEQEIRGDLVLQMRVIKQDGRVLEPEAVSGKPTVTFPHLEIGDYVETEQVFGGEGQGASIYEGPHWFFREKDVAYARSELLMITPAEKKLDIATTGAVPAPVVTDSGYFQVRRWRVDQSPAAPDEPHSVPPVEYLPSVRVTWGVNLGRHLRDLTERVTETTPIDPRIVRIGERIAAGIPAIDESARAQALYRWVLSNVEEGEESDGRRVIVGKRGNRWRGFVTLCRSLGIPVRWALAKNRLAPKTSDPAAEVRQFTTTALRVGERKPVWLTINDKHTPFGYLPSEIRGMPAYLLHGAEPQQFTLPDAGTPDQVRFDAQVSLAADGSADLTLSQAYYGRLGAALRKGLGELGEAQARDVIESKILASSLRGARLLRHELTALDNSDVPLVVRMDARMTHFALAQDGLLRLAPPFVPRLSQFATLPARQTSILLESERRWEVDLRIELPEGARVKLAPAANLRFLDHSVEVNDSLVGKVLSLKRIVHVRAGRIAPDQYAEFVRFTRDADSALSAEVQIQVR